MNRSFVDFLKLDDSERADIFEIRGAEIGTIGSYIEKDFWVSLVLDYLFNGRPPGAPPLSFKGGTSLSKVFGLIHRFSEDIDITVARDALGFARDRDPAQSSLSNKKRAALLDDLDGAVLEYVSGDLTKSLNVLAGDLGVDLIVEPDIDKPATLQLSYPRLIDDGTDAYILPHIKIEVGARAAQEPHILGTIIPLIAGDEFPYDLRVAGIQTVTAQRTFLEKVFILHGWQCRYRDEGKVVEERNPPARHYYDVAMIAGTDEGKAAVADGDLLDQVREHNKLMFRSAWKKFDEGKPGSFCIVPKGDLLKSIERDYESMADMVLGKPPPFGEIMEKIAWLEDVWNTQSK